MNNLSKVNPIYSKVHKSRIKRIQYLCTRTELLHNGSYIGRNSTIYYFSKKYNFAYCKVPKGGSTFWTQTFTVLMYGTSHAKEIFNKPRTKVHSTLQKELTLNFQNIVQQNTESILVSRNPYSRLYSAFIDKAYLPLMTSIATQALTFAAQASGDMTPKICPNVVTFEQFVSWVIAKAKGGATLNRHWAPIYSLSRPCDVKPRMLVKLESFSNDVEYALRDVGVDFDTFSAIIDALRAHRVEATIPGIVSTVQRRYASSKIIRDCYGNLGVEERLWRSFQIQGFLDKDVPFPAERLRNETLVSGIRNYDVFIDVILKAIRQHPLTSEESKRQRKRAIVEAYSTFSPDTIQGIKAVYYVDFMLYNYSMVPPSMDN